uniref:Histidine-containing phosphotransfer protein n=1 Tax=Oryza glumipatula TaxID=40148 RepID=A0A0D9YEU4_9ORYZ
MSNIEQALEKYPRDFNRWDTYMQQLKGSCSSIGASRMKNECMSFRDSCGQGNVEGCMRSFQKVKREHAVLRQKLESYFQLLRQAGPAGAATRPLCSCTWAEEQKGILADDRLAKKPSRQYSMEKGSATNRAIPDFRSAAAMSDAMRRARRRSPCHARNTRNGTRRAGARPDPEPSRQPIRVLGGRSLSVDETWVTSPAAAAVFLRHG